MALTKATQNVIVPDIVTTNTTQTITGTKTFTSTIVGNTATTTKLITARTINGIAFDGTANITIPTGGGGSTSVKAWVNFNADPAANANLSGTYSQSGATVTITTTTAHGLSQGQGIFSNFTSGFGVDGSYTVASITSPTVFTYTALTSLTTSGNVTLNRTSIRAQYNVSSITLNSTGVYTVNFTTPMVDANYCTLMLAGDVVSGGGLNPKVVMVAYDGNPVQKTIYAVRVSSNGTSTVNTSENNVVIFGN